ncbi:hypothetical protein V8C42DRAFT_334308 [Trichoderma barbatum]
MGVVRLPQRLMVRHSLNIFLLCSCSADRCHLGTSSGSFIRHRFVFLVLHSGSDSTAWLQLVETLCRSHWRLMAIRGPVEANSLRSWGASAASIG